MKLNLTCGCGASVELDDGVVDDSGCLPLRFINAWTTFDEIHRICFVSRADAIMRGEWIEQQEREKKEKMATLKKQLDRFHQAANAAKEMRAFGDAAATILPRDFAADLPEVVGQ